ncbi:hypothetical protein AV530_002849 [Patagioenas fasciata monilis]|uniref:Uncharacterized protein n=1 Tax=Patagioenas fasciata monilis TaxID=372326 RepID=A0A1V4K9E7_PATFA|nr:hypothetical protein AV530_002849 [Patagioenas fasciata monilis]
MDDESVTVANAETLNNLSFNPLSHLSEDCSASLQQLHSLSAQHPKVAGQNRGTTDIQFAEFYRYSKMAPPPSRSLATLAAAAVGPR